MAIDPRQNLLDFQRMYDSDVKFSVRPSGECGVRHSRALLGSYDRSATLAGSLGKIGELEILNKVGGGKIGTGLRALASLSDSIRVNGSGTADTVVGQGVKTIYDALGLNSEQLNFAKSFNPQVVNRAQGQIEQIYNRVKQGKFSIEDIPQIFADVQNAERLLRGIFTDNSAGFPIMSQSQCGASPYAMDLIHYAPKHKFLFVVQFEYAAEFQNSMSRLINHAFVVKATTRPTVDFEYEDLNMYNFRTKVARRAVYQPISMRFYDDDRNNALQFYTTYLKAMSPIANLNPSSSAGVESYEQSLIVDKWMQKQVNQALGFQVRADASSVGTPGSSGREINFLKKVTIFHVYRQGRLMNVYNLHNPRILSLKLDDLDMSSSEGNEVEIELSFDGMFVVPGYQVQPGGGGKYGFSNINQGGLYPLGAQALGTNWSNNEKDGLGLSSGQDVEGISSTMIRGAAGGGMLPLTPDNALGGVLNLSGALGGIQSGLAGLGGLVSNITGAIGGIANSVLSLGKNVVGSVVGGITSSVGQVLSVGTSAVGQVMNTAFGTVNTIGNTVGSLANTAISGVSSGIAGLGTSISSGIGTLGSSATSWTGTYLGGTKSNISSSLGSSLSSGASSWSGVYLGGSKSLFG